MTTIRPLESADDYRACVTIQHEVWGADYSDTVPPAILKIVQKIGGIAVGAFDTDGALVGFVFGITGVDNGELVHWSHQLGVRESERNAGIGRHLKEYQRDVLRGLGIKRMRWTFDPLQAKNAHLNLNRLGVDILDYVPDMYGASDSILFRGLKGTDRFIASWELDRPKPRPLANPDGIPLLDGTPTDCPPRLKVAIPLDIGESLRTDPSAGATWRMRTRPAFLWALENGYRVDGFARDTHAQLGYYILTHDPGR
jgi:predicted GNAT superfamily acetyltransferase